MANCKICKRPMPIGYHSTVHRACRTRVANELQEEFCGEMCRYAHSCDEEALAEHCASCKLLQLVNLCREISA